jgi:NADPH-dependent glutamate synthase beta subunit-like oxidoreductase
VVVIGGGNVALDAARTALRAAAYADAQLSPDDEEPEPLPESSFTEAVDVARSAVRAGASDVTVVSLEARHEMPAAEFEIHEAVLEGIKFVHRRGPARILVEDGRAVGVETIGVLSVFDESGRFAPEFDQADRAVLATDTVILAIGQAVDLAAIQPDGPTTSHRGTIEVDADSLATSVAGTWAGGDAVHGPRTLIEAIADGRRAAASIHLAFGGGPKEDTGGQMVVLDQFHRLLDPYDRQDRVSVPSLTTERRIGLREVEVGFSEEQARCEAQRCLRCFANILLDIHACVLCGLCSDVCPLDLIALVPAAEVGGVEGTALLLDESRCIRCGLCIERCPTNALSMGVWNGVGVPDPVPIAVGSPT